MSLPGINTASGTAGPDNSARSISEDASASASAPTGLSLGRAISPMLEAAIRSQVHRSLARMCNRFGRTGAFGEVGITNPLPPPQQQQQQQQQSPVQSRVYNFKQRRMEQDQIDLKVVEHIRIPNGVALRSLIVPQPPDELFTEDYPDMPLNELLQQQRGFEWLDSNASNAEQCSRRAMSRELVKQSLNDWVFLYFRVQKRNWESAVVEEKKSAPDVNMYAEDQVHKWTLKLRFKMLRMAPIKMALNAFLSRMGLDGNPNIVFCRDGFYGLMDVGNIYGELNKTPCAMISFNSTPKYLGLKNGDSIFVNSVTATQRQMMEDVPRHDGPKKKAKDQADGEGEEGEFEFVEEGSEQE